MCDHDSVQDMKAYAAQRAELSRREFGALTVSGGLAMMLPALAGAVAVTETDVDIKTPDGVADAYLVHPSHGRHPAVLMWTDIMGLRPAFRAMGKRLAESGYCVLVPNPFYRAGRAPVVAEGASIEDDATRKTLMSLMATLTPEIQFSDARTYIDYLAAQPAVDAKRKMGTAGYCMGGPMTFRTAAIEPERVGAGASFHGANLANDKPDSPHLLVPRIKARYLIAIAESDDQRDPAAKTLLREAFASASRKAEIEVYAGTIHGWCALDSKVYNQAQAQKAWSRMLTLFQSALV